MKKVRVVLQTDGDFSVLGRTDLDFIKTDYEYIFAMSNSHLDNYYDTYSGNYEGTLIEWVESKESK